MTRCYDAIVNVDSLDQPAASRTVPWYQYASWLVALGAWGYLFAVASLWILLWGFADRWWFATVIQYGPRWVWAVPLLVLLPAVLFFRRRCLAVVLASLFIVFGPVMGFCVSWGGLSPSDSSGTVVRVLSLNVGGGLDANAFSDLVKKTSPDIIAIQESWIDEDFKAQLGPGWYTGKRVARMGLASRFPIGETKVLPRRPFGGYGALAVRYKLLTSNGPVYFLNLHLATPRHALEHVLSAWWRGAESVDGNTEIRRRESEATVALLDKVEGPVLIAGDFNMPIESAVYRRYWSKYSNAFSTAGLGYGYSFGQTRKFRRWVRLDHLLSGPNWRVRRCWVGPSVGSDHWPVIADWELTGIRSE